MAEVHIEESSSLQFAPFNGGYPEHAEHLKKANLDPAYNLWYDIFDHNDPSKSRVNWALMPEGDYESGWFPLGDECPVAVAQTAVGSVVKIEEEGGMTAFNADQLKSMNTASSTTVAVPVQLEAPPLPPATMPPSPTKATAAASETPEAKIQSLINECVSFVPGGNKSWASEAFVQVLTQEASSGGPHKLKSIASITLGPSADCAWVVYESTETFGPRTFKGTAVLKKTVFSGVDCGFVNELAVWTVSLDHRSLL